MKWCFEHIVLPVLILIISLILVDKYKDFVKPDLKENIKFVCIEEADKYKIVTDFTISNKGRSKAERHKVMIKSCGKITNIVEYPKYFSKMERFIGGEKCDYVGYIITLDKGEQICGKISFCNTSGWPNEGIDPIKINF